MKIPPILAIVLVLAGTNVFTYATTRYSTTSRVLTKAQNDLEAGLKAANLHEQFHGAPGTSLRLAVPMAGGMYHWWNDALLFWGLGTFLTLAGLAVSAYGRTKSRQPTD